MHALIASHVFDLRARFWLRQCLHGLHIYATIFRKCADSVPASASRHTIDHLERDEELEQRSHALDMRMRKIRAAHVGHALRLRQHGLLRLCLFALKSHALLAAGLRGSCAAAFIAHRLLGRGVVSIVLRVWRQHVVQQVASRLLHSQLSSVVN